MQRELLPNLLVDVGYVGNKSRDLMILGDFNQARPNGPAENSALQARRPIQGYQFIQAAFDGGKGDYHALQVKLERRYSRGLYLLNSFTWSRARDNASGHLETAERRQQPRQLSRSRRRSSVVSGYDQPLNNTTSFVWELPFGKDRRFGNRPAPGGRRHPRRLAAGRDQHDDQRRAGQPDYTPAATFVGQRTADLPSEPARAIRSSPQATANPTLSSIRTKSRSRRIDRSRSATRRATSVRADPFRQFDLGLHKAFGLGRDQTRIEARIEAFNLFNTTNFGPANGNRSSSAFGTITSTAPGETAAARAEVLFLVTDGLGRRSERSRDDLVFLLTLKSPDRVISCRDR